jgi:hypothetical protein
VSTWWSELSDDELRARLVQRGVDESARVLVTHREHPLAAEMIAERGSELTVWLDASGRAHLERMWRAPGGSQRLTAVVVLGLTTGEPREHLPRGGVVTIPGAAWSLASAVRHRRRAAGQR